MKLNYANRMFILSVIMFIIVMAGNAISINMLFNQIAGINDKVKQLDISSQERERALSLKDSIASTKPEREILDGFFVGASNAAVVDFTKSLEDLAQVSGVTQKKTLNNETAVGLESSSMLSSLRFRFTVSGSWTNVFSFLQAIENLPKVMSLNGLSLNVNSGISSADEAKIGNQTWSANLDFSVIKLNN